MNITIIYAWCLMQNEGSNNKALVAATSRASVKDARTESQRVVLVDFNQIRHFVSRPFINHTKSPSLQHLNFCRREVVYMIAVH